ncbi:hypothetical protein A2859_00900 [Candidatus Roizmanbacteria bacterium RIFCSPHIGHO2_01_FULL_37_16b]|nr:MAG: hypothetical protein A2859_00900 [Candidatus Roizmanbacteria bacterium RIFCSPHIGHO2_01_FULL_37_16b]
MNKMLNRKTLIILSGVPLLLAIVGWDDWLIVWMAVGALSLYVLFQKGYFNYSFIMFLVFGWWFLIFAVAFGSISLVIAAFLPEKKRCPHCRELISKGATRCPKCQADLTVSQAVQKT